MACPLHQYFQPLSVFDEHHGVIICNAHKAPPVLRAPGGRDGGERKGLATTFGHRPSVVGFRFGIGHRNRNRNRIRIRNRVSDSASVSVVGSKRCQTGVRSDGSDDLRGKGGGDWDECSSTPAFGSALRPRSAISSRYRSQALGT